MRVLERTVLGEFALDLSKLQRIVSIISSAFSGISHELTLVATLKNQKRISTHDLQELATIDNAIANPITRLEIEAKSEAEKKNCSIAFRSEDVDFISGVPIIIQSNDVAWASSLFSELEEQVERTILRDQVSKYRQSKILRRLVPLTIVILIGLLSMFFMFRSISSLTPNESELSTLRQLSRTAQSNDQKIDFLVAFSKYQMEKTGSLAKSGFPFSFDLFTFAFFIGASPFIIGTILVAFALFTCYPGSVFLWGDYNDYYLSLIKRRSQIWNTLVIVLLIGLIINLSSTVISRGIGI
jgi:hypothetical protein